jgi:FKBP-type peptidyl-prolyl cis-trans isomerase FklB
MKLRSSLFVLLAVLCTGAYAQEQPEIKTNQQIFSYALGLRIGQNLKQQGLDEVDSRAMAAGIDDVMGGGETRIPLEKVQAAVEAYQKELMAKRAAVAERNAKAGREFLAANKGKDGVVERPSGLQYKILRQGDGQHPGTDDSVVVQYRGRLLDGREFDSSYERGEPTTLKVGSTIKGWQEALPLMQVGSKWRLFVPPDLAYGERGVGDTIGPNQTLIFDVELISVKQGDKS